MYIVLGGLYHLVLMSPFHVVEEEYRVIIFFFFFLLSCNFFFNLKFSWGRLEKETQIPEELLYKRFGHSDFITRTKGKAAGSQGVQGPCGDAGGFRPGLTSAEVLFCPLPSPAVLWKVTSTGCGRARALQVPLCPQHHLCAMAQCRDPFLPTGNSG